jgi:hypothetical protein
MPAPRQAGRELAEFGELIGWGTNADGATRRLTQISDMTLPEVTQEIARLRTAGVTRQMAQQWADYYAAELT